MWLIVANWIVIFTNVSLILLYRIVWLSSFNWIADGLTGFCGSFVSLSTLTGHVFYPVLHQCTLNLFLPSYSEWPNSCWFTGRCSRSIPQWIALQELFCIYCFWFMPVGLVIAFLSLSLSLSLFLTLPSIWLAVSAPIDSAALTTNILLHIAQLLSQQLVRLRLYSVFIKDFVHFWSLCCDKLAILDANKL